MNEFIEAILQILKLNGDNLFIQDLIKEELKKVHPDDRKEFMTILFNEKSTFNETDRFNNAISKYQEKLKSRIFNVDKEEFAKELENKIEGLSYQADQVARDEGKGLDYAKKLFENLSINFKDLKKTSDKTSFFTKQEIYIIEAIGTLIDCKKLINLEKGG